jgi:hypothetical protein
VRYIYLGDRMTDASLKGQPCDPVKRPDGKCIRGRNGAMPVRFADGIARVVIGRRLRINTSETPASQSENLVSLYPPAKHRGET